ncbi:MAG: hypothetical protein H6554_09780 [Chitinophagales bacterium]|nr:hypothetical protein [Chitinophagales bacterium]
MPPLHNNLPVSYVAQENTLHFWTELQQAQTPNCGYTRACNTTKSMLRTHFSLPQQLPAGVYFYQILTSIGKINWRTGSFRTLK